MTAPVPSPPMDRFVDPGYQHRDKVAVPTPAVAAKPGLKWYEIHAPEVDVDETVRVEARAVLATDDEYTPDDVGFVLLHLCGESFYFLLVSRWRGNNELWQTVYTKDGSGDFELTLPEPTKATYCAWELGVVNHERLAWITYLRSARDDRDRAVYLADHFSGRV
jgi:hypothetical protein